MLVFRTVDYNTIIMKKGLLTQQLKNILILAKLLTKKSLNSDIQKFAKFRDTSQKLLEEVRTHISKFQDSKLYSDISSEQQRIIETNEEVEINLIVEYIELEIEKAENYRQRIENKHKQEALQNIDDIGENLDAMMRINEDEKNALEDLHNQRMEELKMSSRLIEQQACLEILSQKYETENMVSEFTAEQLRELKYVFNELEEQFFEIKLKIYSSIGYMSRGQIIEWSLVPFSNLVQEASKILNTFDFSMTAKDEEVNISKAQNLMFVFRSYFEKLTLEFHQYKCDDCRSKSQVEIKEYKNTFREMVDAMTKLQTIISDLKAPRVVQPYKQMEMVCKALENGNLFKMIENDVIGKDAIEWSPEA